MGTSNKIDRDLILFDGTCNLCNGAVNFIIDRDPKLNYQFASLQSEIASELLPQKVREIDSIVLLTKSGKVYTKSSAALEIAKNLRGFWFLLSTFKIIPIFLRDGVYKFVAKNRYRWFGKQDRCRIPTDDLRERFLETS